MALASDDELTVGEVASRSGIAPSAVRFYEEKGLIFSTRTTGNQRRYPRHVLRRISIIIAARHFGISLADVADVLAELPDDRKPSKRDWRRISERWREQLATRRREIELLEEQLVGCIGCGCLSMTKCKALNPGDRLAAQGPGPRRVIGDAARARPRSTAPTTATDGPERAL